MRAVLRWTAIGAGLLLVLTAGLCLASYRKFSANITTDSAAEKVLAEYAAQRPPSLVPQARNILVLGADPAAMVPAGGPGAAAEEGAGRDAAVLLHLSADRTRAAAVGVPRDLRVGVPGCRRPGGGTVPAAYEPFAAAFRNGGAACSIRAFEQLSGVRVDHHLVVDVLRFGRIADAVGDGAGAAGGDPRGDLLQALAGAARGGQGSLAHPARLFGLLDTATSAITADPGLSSLPALYGLAGALRSLPPQGVTLVTLPTAPSDGSVQGRAGGDVLRHPAADRLFAALRADRPLVRGGGP